MTDSYIQIAPDSTGKKMQTFQNTVSASVVEAEAVSLVNSSGASISPATEATLSTLNGKVTACNTGAVVIASGAVTATIDTIATITNVVHVDDNSGTLTVDQGTASNLKCEPTQTTPANLKVLSHINTVKDGSGTSYTPLSDADGHQQIDVLSCATHDVTSNSQNIATESTLSTLNGKVTACNTGAVVLAAGSAAIGKLVSNTGVDIGDVDVTSVIPGVAATNLGKAEDAAHNSGDTGVAVLGVRDDTLGVFSGAEGDYEPFHMTAAGRLYTSATIDAALPAGTNGIGKLTANSGVDIGDVDVASIVPGTGATNLGKAEDVAHSSGDVGVQVLAIRDDTCDARSGTENDYEPLHTDSVGRLWVNPTLGASYKTAYFSASADGDIVAAVASKVIKVHGIALQAAGTVTINIRTNNVGGTVLSSWTLQAREGVSIAPASYPMYWFKTAAGEALYCDVTAAVAVTINVIYTDADTS